MCKINYLHRSYIYECPTKVKVAFSSRKFFVNQKEV